MSYFWYLSMGLQCLFWVWYLDGTPSGDKWWLVYANVITLTLLWPVHVVMMIAKSVHEYRSKRKMENEN